MEKKKLLIDFVERTKSFDNISKLKLILFAAGVKPNTFVALKITPKNLQDKIHFEEHLKENGVVYVVSKPKSFEEISSIRNNRVIWVANGVWYGYDLFKDEKSRTDFEKYVNLLRKKKHEEADLLAGRIYGYPSCCIRQYIREHDNKYLKRNFTYYEYYKKLKEADRKFSFLNHTPCSSKCNNSYNLNKRYSTAIKKYAEKFYKEYTKKRRYATNLLIDELSDVYENKRSIWSKKEGYEYALIAKRPYQGHYYMYSYLTKTRYDKGTVLSAVVEMQHNHADIKVNKVMGKVSKLHHERKFKLLGKK